MIDPQSPINHTAAVN